ncbi:MAG: hypothetical protein L6V84_08280 [Oscillospiraceae bacterium]|nr:MAG: hypothetical protein L6V84_08280 [Oscillospiraceae bacterium]
MEKVQEIKIVSNVVEKNARCFFLETAPDMGDYVKILGRINNKRSVRYISKDYLLRVDQLDYFKLFIPEANNSGMFGETLTEPIVGEPNECSADTFLCGGMFDLRIEPENFAKYFKTKFFRALLGIKKTPHHCPPIVWETIPVQKL